MDLASLAVEIKQPRIPQIAIGWTNEDYLLLLKMYNDKCTPSTLATHFKKTRGQIAGIIWRAKQNGFIESRPRLLKNPKPKADPVETLNKVLAKQLLKKLLVKKVKKLRRVRLRLIDSANLVTFAELEPHHCRWGFGDPRQSDFRFCGCRRELTKPYCAEHVLKAGRLYDQIVPIVRPSYRRR